MTNEPNDQPGDETGSETDGRTAEEADSGVSAGPVSVRATRTDVLLGTMGVVLAGAFVLMGVLFARLADTSAELDSVRVELAAGGPGSAPGGELAALRSDVERIEAGAALYASQLEGLQTRLSAVAPDIEAGVDEAISGLRDFGESTISFDVAIDETIPVDTEVVIRRTVAVPIVTEIPIREDIDTTITVSTPFGGIPIDVNVPVDVVVPIDLVVDIPIDETVPIVDEFPVQLDVPIAIDVGETELKNLTDSIASGLESLRDLLADLDG